MTKKPSKKQKFLSEFEESLKEVRLMREGKKPKRRWNDFKKSGAKT
jgi:hypothetical protein